MVVDLNYVGLLTLLAAMGFVGNSYQFFARSQGWPVGALFDGGLASASIVGVPIAIGFAWYEYGWIYGLAVLVAGFVLAYILTLVLKYRVQHLWAALFLAAVGYIGYRVILKLMA